MNLFKIWLSWRKRKSKDPIYDWDKGCGYYRLPEPGEEVALKLESGRTGIYRFIRSENYWDPHDMIEHAWFQLVGYEGEKRFADMTFKEFRQLIEKRDQEGHKP